MDRLQIRRSRRASYNRAKKAAAELLRLMEIDPDNLTGGLIGDMRDEVEAVNKAFHEFSAYHNVQNWKE